MVKPGRSSPFIDAFRAGSRYRRLTREGFWVLLANILSITGLFAGVRVLTELLDPSAYGQLALAMTIVLLIEQSLLGPLSQGVMRYYAPAAEKNDVRSYLRDSGRLAAKATFIATFLLLAASASAIAFGNWHWALMMVAILCLSLLSGYNAILNGIQNAARKRSTVALHQGMLPWGRVLGASALVVMLGASSMNAMIGYVIAGSVVLGSQAFFLRRMVSGEANASASVDPSWQEQMLAYSWPIAIWGIFSGVQTISDRWAVELFATTADVGLYAVLLQLGYRPMSLATGLAVQFFAPIVFQRAGDASDARRNQGARRITSRLTLLCLILTAIAFLLTAAFHAPLFRLLVASEYWQISYLLPWVLLSGGLFASGQTVALHLMGMMKSRELLPVKVGTSLLGIALNFLGGFLYGIPGIVAAGVVFAAAYLFWILVLSARAKV